MLSYWPSYRYEVNKADLQPVPEKIRSQLWSRTNTPDLGSITGAIRNQFRTRVNIADIVPKIRTVRNQLWPRVNTAGLGQVTG